MSEVGNLIGEQASAPKNVGAGVLARAGEQSCPCRQSFPA